MLVAYAGNRPAMPVLLQDLMRLQGKGEAACCVAFAGSRGVVTVTMSGPFSTLVDALVPHGCSRARSGFGMITPCCEDQADPLQGSVGQDERGLVSVGLWGRVDNLDELTAVPGDRETGQAEQSCRFLAGRIALALGPAGDQQNSLDSVLERVRGRFSLVCLHSRRMDRLWWACRGLPLFLGRGRAELFVSTDLKTILAHGVEPEVVRLARLCCGHSHPQPAGPEPSPTPRLREPTCFYRAPRHHKLNYANR